VRSHGVPGWPDPNSKGSFLIRHLDMYSSQVRSANKACQHLLSGGGQVTAAQLQQGLNQALEFAACMRGHGLSLFPDPTVQDGNIIFGAAGIHINPSSPQFTSAQQACRKFQGLPGGES
jgi:hypothetical protein